MKEAQTAGNVIVASRTIKDIPASDLFHAEWEKAEPVHLVQYWSGEDAPSGRHAVARIIWSEEALCVRFVCNQDEPPVINDRPETSSKTMGLWERDVCEIFVAPVYPERYFEFEAAPTGEWIDLQINWKPEARETDWQYISGMTAAALVEERRVLVAMRVPWEAFGQRPSAGDMWRVNLFRCVGAGQERGYLAWQPTRTTRPNFHVPYAFGWLRFDR